MTNDRAEVLRRRIATHRSRLAEGVDAELARIILAEIVADEAELARLTRDNGKRN
jgi:hypothetical protein